VNQFSGSVVTVQIAAIAFLVLWNLGGPAFAQDVYYPTEPPLADSGWTVPYNELLVACYQGNMDACDRVASDKGMVWDTVVSDYARTCGGRLDKITARNLSARMLENGILEGTCSYNLRPK
jgi:hypothetical protein